MIVKKPSQKIVQSGIYNTIFAAPDRSGKGVSSVVPTLLLYSGSALNTFSDIADILATPASTKP